MIRLPASSAAWPASTLQQGFFAAFRASLGRGRLILPLVLFGVGACTVVPAGPYTLDDSPLSHLSASGQDVVDQRARFREILCQVNAARGKEFPHYRPCNRILQRFSDEPPGTGEPVNLGPPQSKLHFAMVPGLGADCIAGMLVPFRFGIEHLQSLGFDASLIEVDGLFGSAHNGRQIRDAVLAMNLAADEKLVLLGYSKGLPDILEGLAAYPELEERVAAVVGLAGSAQGSPLAEGAEPWWLTPFEYLPGAECRSGDGDALESLEPDRRRTFNANFRPAETIRFYSLGSFSRREQISSLLQGSYDELAAVDPRNDGMMIFFDQVMPWGALLGFTDADHWALALPFSREQPVLAATLINRNRFPREILMEAVARHLEEQLQAAPGKLG